MSTHIPSRMIRACDSSFLGRGEGTPYLRRRDQRMTSLRRTDSKFVFQTATSRGPCTLKQAPRHLNSSL